MPTPFGMVDVKQPELDPLPPRPGSPNARRVSPAREPGMMPGSAEEAKSLGVVPANSLRAPQPDMSSLMNTAPRSRQARRGGTGNNEGAQREAGNDGQRQPGQQVRTTGSFRSLDDAVRTRQQAVRPQNATPEPVQLRNQVEVNVD